MEAAKTSKLLSPIGRQTGEKPRNERQSRPLKQLPPGERKAAWNQATAAAKKNGRKVTARDVKEAVASRLPERRRHDHALPVVEVGPLAVALTRQMRHQ